MIGFMVWGLGLREEDLANEGLEFKDNISAWHVGLKYSYADS